ncbi:MAG: hypothetical protein LBD55_02485 [Treponema sp.]|jgi:hypothetical protein|nr:hypothetical protein [Treponema sp.]
MARDVSLQLVLGNKKVTLGVDYVGAYMRKDGTTKFSVTATCLNKEDARIVAQALGELGVNDPQ